MGIRRLWPREISQWVKALAAKSKDLSLIPRSYQIGGKKSPGLHMHAECPPPHPTPCIKINVSLFVLKKILLGVKKMAQWLKHLLLLQRT